MPAADLFTTISTVASAVISTSAAVAVVAPPPQKQNGFYYYLYKTINLLGMNVGHASNGSGPTQSGTEPPRAP